ncbi:MAG: MerR family transcriptional regulator [Eubacteriales bacterium]
MEYTVQKLSKLAGITSRTLRYYDEIGLLKPAKINSSGYRIYGQKEVDMLQQILFYRALGVELANIQGIITSPGFDSMAALKEHHENLLQKKLQLDALITNVEKTIAWKERRIIMSDKEKFVGFKQKMINDNEEKYGKEIREKYGEDVVEKSNYKVKTMTEEEYDEVATLTQEIMDTLFEAMKIDDPAGELAQKAAEMHKKWLSFYWDQYSKEAHAGLAQMYVDDERFTAYYDEKQPGTAKFLRDAIFVYTGMKK